MRPFSQKYFVNSEKGCTFAPSVPAEPLNNA